ncbi:MAG: hypothetical protein ABL958_02650 [Bdellovibrionia bacterium]
MQFLLSLPKAIIVFLALFVSLLVIMILQPPHTACNSQFEIFQASQMGFLYLDPKVTYKKTTGYEKSIELCKYGNSPGGCLDFFNGIKKLQKDLESVPGDCASEVSGNSSISKPVWDSLTFMVQLAWGSRPPGSYLERAGWFDTYHLSIFCDLKRLAIAQYGRDSWSRFVDTQLKSLPQATSISRNESWQRSVLSFPCESL